MYPQMYPQMLEIIFYCLVLFGTSFKYNKREKPYNTRVGGIAWDCMEQGKNRKKGESGGEIGI